MLEGRSLRSHLRRRGRPPRLPPGPPAAAAAAAPMVPSPSPAPETPAEDASGRRRCCCRCRRDASFAFSSRGSSSSLWEAGDAVSSGGRAWGGGVPGQLGVAGWGQEAAGAAGEDGAGMGLNGISPPHSASSAASRPSCASAKSPSRSSSAARSPEMHVNRSWHFEEQPEEKYRGKKAVIRGANVNAAKLHETALHHAAKVKNADLVEMLVEFGGNIYARDNRGKKPADYTWSSSRAAKCFEYYEKTPLCLSQLCRLSLRRAFGQRALEKIAQLHIPPRLIEFLSYK